MNLDAGERPDDVVHIRAARGRRKFQRGPPRSKADGNEGAELPTVREELEA
jgi:hypothetical protein